jgi:TolB-like protein/Tfp pilus assembly protein PilF
VTSGDDALHDDAAEHWRRVEALLDAALAREPGARAAFLDAECAGDDALRREVDSLLAAHEGQGMVDRLAGDLAPLAARVRASAYSPPRGAPIAGRTIGRYRVVAPVGGGGMGIVYKAIDERLGRTVALKFLQPRFGPDDSAAERFRHEARTVAALEHPNICTVHEIGETDDGQLYIAMPLYDGHTLQRRIADGPLPVDEAVAIAVQVARGLAKAHARGIVHRDVKPSNVFVTDDGVVKLLDFGIAKLADVTLTGAGTMLGTAAYMSPEQARGEPVDHRSDLWSLGVLLYEMLAGRRAFPGDAASVVLESIQHGRPVPLADHRPDVPPALARLVETLLAKAPDARPASAQALERALLALGLAEYVPGGLAPAATSGQRHGAPGTRRWGIAAAAIVAVAVLAVAATALWRARAGERAPTPSSLAVLPFADRSPARDQEYFSDGITDELIATLGRVDGLRVASRTSSFAFKGRASDVRAVAAQLGVATVLEGSVRREGERLRITVQLVNAADGYQLWSEAYDREARDAFAVQQDIARAIAQVLRVRLAGASGDTAAAPGAEAYDLYLKGRHALYLRGRYAWYSRTEEGVRAAARYFEQAVAQAPEYARAHAGLADTYVVLAFYDYMRPTEAFPRAVASARRAAELDPTLGSPHATLAYALLYHEWDFARAEDEFKRAIALEPNYSTGHQWYANLLMAAGRFDEAERAMARAEELDPLALIAKAAQGWVLYHAGKDAAALEKFRQTLELNPDYAIGLLWRGWTLQSTDSLDAAVTAHRRAVALTDSGGLFLASLARSLALAGERAEAERLLAALESRGARGDYVPSYELAKVHEALGRPERALDWLERAYRERAHSMVYLRVDPQLRALRTHPRFVRLEAQVFDR